jgi:4-amino-4-deoxy-L-arabinose transferase-like glycosyltransferase
VSVDRGLSLTRPASISRLLSLVGPPALAAVLVFYDLGARSLWVDEGATLSAVTQHGAEFWRQALADGGNMVAFYGLLHVVVTWFGFSAVLLRLPSAVAVVITVCAAQELVRRLFGRREAVLAALFVAVCLPLVYWGQMARGYAMAICLLTAAALAFVIALRGGPPVSWVAFVLLSALSIYTILLSALFVVSLLASVVMLPRREIPLRRLTIATAATAALCAPLLFTTTHTGTYPIRWIQPIASNENALLWHLLTATGVVTVKPAASSDAMMLLTLVLWIFAIVLLVRSLVRHGRSWSAWSLGLLVFTFVGPIAGLYLLSVLVHPVFQDRYGLNAVVPGSILVAYVVSRVKPVWLMTVFAVALLGVRALQLSPSYAVPVEDWQNATAYTLASATPRDCIAFFQVNGYGPFDFYAESSETYRSALPRLVLPETTWASHNLVLNPPTLSASALRKVTASCPTLWLVTTHVNAPVTSKSPVFTRQTRARYEALLSGLNRSYRVTSDRLFVGVEVRRFAAVPASTRSPSS